MKSDLIEVVYIAHGYNILIFPEWAESLKGQQDYLWASINSDQLIPDLFKFHSFTIFQRLSYGAVSSWYLVTELQADHTGIKN